MSYDILWQLTSKPEVDGAELCNWSEEPELTHRMARSLITFRPKGQQGLLRKHTSEQSEK